MGFFSNVSATDVMSALPVVGPIIGGVLNANAQKAANKYNLQAVRETNAQNAEIARAQLQQQQSQFERQLKYLSPFEQRKMLEQAGFNPAALLNGGQTSSAGTPHTGVSQQMIPGHVDPVTGFGNALMEMSANLRNIAEAKKLDSERKGQDIENENKLAMIEKTLEALGYQNRIAEVKAKYAGQEEEQFYKQLIKDNLFKQEEIERVQIANKIQRDYNEKIQPQELNKLLDEIALLKEEKITQQHLQSYYDAAGKAGLTSAAAQKLMADIENFYKYNKNEMYGSQATLNSALGGESSQRYVGLNIDNEIKKVVGKPMAMAQLRSLIKGGNLSEAMAQKVWKENKILQKEINWYEFKQVVGAARSVAGTAEEALFIKALW